MQQLTVEDIAHIIELYHKTNSRKQIARELGLSEYRVRRILVQTADESLIRRSAKHDSLPPAI